MARKATRIALILPKGHEYALRLIRGALHAAAVDHRGDYRFVEIPYDEGHPPPDVDSIAVDGALVWTHADASCVLALRDRGVKVVSFNSEWFSAGIPCVGMDLDATLDGAVSHLATLGRSHAAYIGHAMAHSAAKQVQQRAFLDRARARAWTAATIDVPGIPSLERHRLESPEAERELSDFLRGLQLPAVAFCDDDYVATLVCKVAMHVGLAVPGDLAVLGYMDMTVARFNVPTISSVPGSARELGATGMRILADMLAGHPPPAHRVFVAPPDVVVRESTGGTTVRDDDMRRVHELILGAACQGLTVDQLLGRVSMSQKTLNKRYEAVYGLTPGAAIRRVRAERAKELLETTDLLVSRVAELCGFDEPSNFNIFFNREVGCTPGQHRARQRKRRAVEPGAGPTTSSRTSSRSR